MSWAQQAARAWGERGPAPAWRRDKRQRQQAQQQQQQGESQPSAWQAMAKREGLVTTTKGATSVGEEA